MGRTMKSWTGLRCRRPTLYNGQQYTLVYLKKNLSILSFKHVQIVIVFLQYGILSLCVLIESSAIVPWVIVFYLKCVVWGCRLSCHFSPKFFPVWLNGLSSARANTLWRIEIIFAKSSLGFTISHKGFCTSWSIPTQVIFFPCATPLLVFLLDRRLSRLLKRVRFQQSQEVAESATKSAWGNINPVN
jgi:hypothetical protein